MTAAEGLCSKAPETVGAEAPETAYRRFLKSGEIRLQRCEECDRQIFPPRVLCPRCGSERLTWRLVNGRATVYSATTVRQRPDRGGDYNIAIVEFQEGARMLSRVNGVPARNVAIGSAVVPVIDQVDEAPVVMFVPAAGGAA